MIGYLGEIKYRLQRAEDLIKIIKEKSKYKSLISWNLIRIEFTDNETMLILPIEKLSEFQFQLNLHYIGNVDNEDFNFEEVEECLKEQIEHYEYEVTRFDRLVSEL